MSTFQLPSDPLYRSFFLRTLSHASSSGADSGECFRALQDASPLTPASWLMAWSKMGSRLDKHAACMLSAKPSQNLSARMAYLRASNYHRTAFAPLFGHPLDKALVMPSYAAMRSSFAEAAKLFDPPLTPLRIPFEKTALPGYLCSPSSTTPSNGRLMVIISGYDAPMEEVYFFVAHHALSRGYTCIIFDGPGQGGTLLESEVTLSHVYDKALDSVLQEAAKHGAWNQTVVQGLSLGGLLCLQAVSPAAIQSKVHAVIADPGEKNLLDMFRQRLPFPKDLRDQMPDGTGDAIAILDFMLTRMSLANDATGWALRRGMLVHGVTTPLDYARILREFDNAPILGEIGIPTLITKAENDDIAAQAEEVFEKLTGSASKALIKFSDEEGAGEHCSNGARSFFNEQIDEAGVLFGDKIAETFGEADNIVVHRRSVGLMQKAEVSMGGEAMVLSYHGRSSRDE